MKLRNRQLYLDYHQLFESPGGQRILEDLHKKFPHLRQPLICGASQVDPYKVILMEGEANVLKYIYKMLRRDPNEEIPSKAKTGE